MNRKKQNIIDAAYSLFIEKGYSATSIQEILDEAGISKGTFYNYFASKTECLIAIMESVGAEIRQKRMECAAGKRVDDKEVLSDQLAVRIQVNREKNLFSLYESIFYSQDKELKDFAKNSYKKELDWMSSRIIDLYGHKAAPYALDNAASMHGSTQQLVNLWLLTTDEDLPPKRLASFVVDRLEVSLLAQIDSGERFILAPTVYTEKTAENLTVEELAEQLEAFAGNNPEDSAEKQLILFLAGELKIHSPRKALLESVLGTLSSIPGHESELMILLEQVWKKLAKF
ncbi:TetR/AcrR family transcriptional regulator [Metaplanococcus flavidus]|uniref:TetR/AcrR family transcriptional regulator n=1 Tax=Metaplanococcus flavidus TaxID=569883 RepID=A0ABW3LAQ2_9BACL